MGETIFGLPVIVTDKKIEEESIKFGPLVTCFICGGESNKTCECHNGQGGPCDMECNADNLEP